MSNEINYKSKYEALKLRFMNSVDAAFRLGYEQGMADAALDQANQQMQQAQQMSMQQASMPEQPHEHSPEDSEEAAAQQESPEGSPSENPEGSELDQHIKKLEDMISKSELSGNVDVKKSLEDLVSLRKTQLQSIQIAKSEKAVKGIAKSLKRPALPARKAMKNLDDNAKKSLSLQEKIVNDVMKSFEMEEKRSARDILSVLDKE